MPRGELLKLDDVDTYALFEKAKAQFVLSPTSVHGPKHWLSVLANGELLARSTNADFSFVVVFSLLHDCRRENEWLEPQHGARAASLAKDLNGILYDFDDLRLSRLTEALRFHDAGKINSDIDISCCWSADRIKLRRVGIESSRWGFCDVTWPIAKSILADWK